MADACGSARASHTGLSFSLRSLLDRHDQPIVSCWPIGDLRRCPLLELLASLDVQANSDRRRLDRKCHDPGRRGRREPNALAKSSRRVRDKIFRLDWRSFGAAWLHSRPVMSRQQHELAVTAEQGVLERHFDTITLRSQAATIRLDAATWPECMLIVRDPFANKRAVEHSGGGDHISGRLSEAA